MARQQAQPLILPKGWPRRVRSAVLHAISLARVTLLAARAQAVSNYQSRSRIERLQMGKVASLTSRREPVCT